MSQQLSPRVPEWRKASYSMSDGSCVEVGISEYKIIVRDSTHPVENELVFTLGAWNKFLAMVKEFELRQAISRLAFTQNT